MGQFVDRTGITYGRLTVIEKSSERGSSGNVKWFCLCDCGNKCLVSGSSLKSGSTKSCGCLFLDVAASKGRAKKVHGMTNTKIYSIWSNMRNRCLNPAYKKYHAYGGRGIKISKDWDSFEVFFKDMGLQPEGMTLDRIDVNGDYCKENCRWATQKEQQNNRRDNVILEYESKKYTMQQLCEHLGKNSDKVQQRLKRGDSLDRALR